MATNAATDEPGRALNVAAETVAIVIVSTVVLLFLGLPVFAIIERALRNSDVIDVASSSEVIQALRLSFETTAISLALVILLGTPLAYLLARSQFPGHEVVDALINFPIVNPQIVGRLGVLVGYCGD